MIRFSPLIVPALLVVASASSNWRIEAQSISTFQNHTCVTDTSGELYCWGEVSWGGGRQVVPYDADPLLRIPHVPGVRFATIAVGWIHDCALIQTGQIVCSGTNYQSELGRDTNQTCSGGHCGRPDSIMTSERFRSVVSGQSHSCGLTRDGRAFCWGMNDAGQTGIGSRVPIVQRPTAVFGGYRFLSLAAGSRHTCGISVDGETLCWGANSNSQLGINTARRGCPLSATCTAVPAPLDDPKDFVTLSAGQDKTCGITRVGTLYCWGFGYGGGRGDRPLTLTRIGSSMTFSAVNPGYWFTCAIAVGGKAYCWKEDDHAIIGQSLVRWGCRDAPACIDEAPVSNTLRFRALASGQAHACGITVDGAVYCWGLKHTEKIGDRIGQCEIGQPDPTHECTAEPVRVGGRFNVLGSDESRPRNKP